VFGREALGRGLDKLHVRGMVNIHKDVNYYLASEGKFECCVLM